MQSTERNCTVGKVEAAHFLMTSTKLFQEEATSEINS